MADPRQEIIDQDQEYGVLMAELRAARAWRDAQAEADAALARAADINQGCEPGSKRGSHREALQAEQRAREARDRYDAVRGWGLSRHPTPR